MATEPKGEDHRKRIDDLRRRIKSEAGLVEPQPVVAADPWSLENVDQWKAADPEHVAKELVRAAFVARAGLAPVADFAGPLPPPVLWMDARCGGGTVLRAGEVAVLSGAGGVGKSFVALAMAVASASGKSGAAQAVGIEVRPGPAVVMSYEDAPRTVAYRAGMITEKVGCKPGKAPDKMYLIPDPDPLMTAVHERPGESARGQNWPTLFTAIKAVEPSLLIVDPASAALAGVNQNDGATVRRFIRELSLVADTSGYGVLILTHSTKAARYGQGDPGPGAIAGSGQWWDAARGVLYMRGAGPGKAVIQCKKANHGPTGWAVELEADMRKRGQKPPVFAGWKRVCRYSPSEWEAEARRQEEAKKAQDKRKNAKASKRKAPKTSPNASPSPERLEDEELF